MLDGDARASLEREAPQNFDVLVVDAFSGDAIPLHLLTHGGDGVYKRHLAPGGMLAFHVSNSASGSGAGDCAAGGVGGDAGGEGDESAQ